MVDGAVEARGTSGREGILKLSRSFLNEMYSAVVKVGNIHPNNTSMLAILLCMMNIEMGSDLHLSLNNIHQAKGSIFVAVYDSESSFLNPDKLRDKKIVAVSNTGSMDITFSNLPPGTYAISCFHDVNGNGVLDTNFLGIPTEPYGFSNNARPKFRAPNWAETKFYLKAGGETQSIRLETW